MRKLKKVLFCIICNSIFSEIFVQNFVYADLIDDTITDITYSPLYYIAIIASVAIVMIISICILRKIYKENQAEKNETKENKGGEDGAPKL